MKTIKECGEIKLVGYRVLCDGDKFQEEIPKAAHLLKERTSEIKNVLNSGWQVGAFIVDAPTPDEDGYWVCVQVSDYKDIPEGLSVLTVPPNKYATIIHNGPNYLIMENYESLHHWIENQGLKRDNKSWNLEFYLREENTSEDVYVELCDSIY